MKADMKERTISMSVCVCVCVFARGFADIVTLNSWELILCYFHCMIQHKHQPEINTHGSAWWTHCCFLCWHFLLKQEVWKGYIGLVTFYIYLIIIIILNCFGCYGVAMHLLGCGCYGVLDGWHFIWSIYFLRVNFSIYKVVFGSFSPGEDFLFLKNIS